VHAITREALRLLGIGLPFEIYQSAGLFSLANAAVITLVEETILISTKGPLITDLDDDCLLAVMGHEIGHHIAHGPRALDYGSVVVASWISASKRTQKLAPAFMMSQEITADRFGLLACQDLDVALRVEMMLTSGLDSTALNWVSGDYLRQCQELMEDYLERGETVLGFTHPEHSFRAYAAWLFSESDAYARLTGQSPGFLSIGSVNATLCRLVMPKGFALKAPDDTPPPKVRHRVSPIPRSRLTRAVLAKKRTRPPR
jgi:hypothetical protein